MSTSGVNSSTQTQQSSSSNETQKNKKQKEVPDRYESLGTEAFLKMLTAELQSQDPTEPIKNSELLQQISQIREIQSNTKLSDALDTVMLGQNLATASSLLGRTITGLNDDSTWVEGVVDKITVTDGKPVLHVGDHELSLNNVAGIVPAKTEE
jgi:flagellar basal-body rod modification protein FlgD